MQHQTDASRLGSWDDAVPGLMAVTTAESGLQTALR